MKGLKWLPVIDPQLCDGCGACAEACGPRCLQIIDGCAQLTDPNVCGSEAHCIAPCPRGAIRMEWVPANGTIERGCWYKGYSGN